MKFYWRIEKLPPAHGRRTSIYRVETSFRYWGVYAFGPTMAVWYWLSGIVFKRHGFGNRLESWLDMPASYLFRKKLPKLF